MCTWMQHVEGDCSTGAREIVVDTAELEGADCEVNGGGGEGEGHDADGDAAERANEWSQTGGV